MPSSLVDSLTHGAWQNILVCAVVAACVLPALFRDGAVERIFRSLERILSDFAQRKSLAIASMFVIVLAVRLAILRLLPIPLPGIHDEFSYLLLGETFAHGRLTNPTHPMWRSFETFHVNWLPTYSSMYPPAQGAVLAIGQLLGNPWFGVLISNAAMCAVILWMLQGWMPARWALLGAILLALKLGVASYWMNSYWGGAVGAIGGALVLGAVPRIRKHARPRDALLLALGVAILANSRPYEGLLLCLPVAVWLVFWLCGGISAIHSPHVSSKVSPVLASQSSSAPRLRRVMFPIAVVLVLTAGFMGFYNSRVTGNALLFPYTLNLRTYVTAPVFLWQHAKPAMHYNNQAFEDFYNDWERNNYRNSAADVRAVSREKWLRIRSVFFWPAAALLLPGVVFVFRDKRVRFLLTVFLIVAPGIFMVVWSNPHYAAPLTCVIFALLVQAVRHLRAWQPFALPVGAALSRATLILLVLQITGDVIAHRCDELSWTCGGDPSRAAILHRLTALPGKHLILVRYQADHNIHDEWVFNGAEIDTAKVLWARELDPQQNSALLEYFKDRAVWLVDPDADNQELLPRPRPPAGRTP